MALGRGVRLADLPHHDGSARYTEPGPYSLGDTVTVRLRVPGASSAERVRVRSVPDAEPSMTEARIDRTSGGTTWWVAELALCNPVTNYRFLLEGGAIGHGWLNESCLSAFDVSDGGDFRISVHPPAPHWLSETVGYQIFLDRFADSGEHRELPDWAIRQDWDDPLATDHDRGTRQFYGGDLPGIEKHLDHLERVGVNLAYLTPFFPAGSTHRYDASTFDRVDPLLGGDHALSSLIDAAHRRGIRVIGDITLNHTGDHHDWFRTAQRDQASVAAGFYMFGDGPDDYVAWHDVPSLPKLDHRSEALADRLYRGPGSVIARYLGSPFGLDGWRVDCANTTARHGDIDVNHRVARSTRATIDAQHPEAWLLAEHCFDSGPDLRGDGWQGAMAYQWFSRPLWAWLRGDRALSLMNHYDLPRLDGAATVAAMRELGADVPWAARQASMTMIDSHDSARFRTAVGGDAWRHTAGIAALMTMPGVPTLFAGSEVGVEGDSMDSCRVPFPWDEERWDHELFDATSALVEMRRTNRALQNGGLRWLDASDDSIVFVRETEEEATVVHLARTAGASATVDVDDLDVGDVAGSTILAGTAPVVAGGSLTMSGTSPATVLSIPR